MYVHLYFAHISAWYSVLSGITEIELAGIWNNTLAVPNNIYVQMI